MLKKIVILMFIMLKMFIFVTFLVKIVLIKLFVMKEIYLHDLVERFKKWFYQPTRFPHSKNDGAITLTVSNYTNKVWFCVHIPFDCINYFSHSTIQRFESKRKIFVLTSWIVNIPKKFIELNFYYYDCNVITSPSCSVKFDCVDDLPF